MEDNRKLDQNKEEAEKLKDSQLDKVSGGQLGADGKADGKTPEAGQKLGIWIEV